MFEIPFASELTNLVNFIIMDLLLLPYVMYVSGLLAGYANHSTLCKARKLHLVVFDIPLVGGGIVMSRCWLRTFFISIRLSVVAAVAISNFGLEGRSKTEFVVREATVRVPGALKDPFTSIYTATERRMRCSDSTESGDFNFGAVIDDRCYLDKKDYVFFSQLAFNLTNIAPSATNCKSSPHCSQVRTTFHCDGVDLVCAGTSEDSKCEVADGVQLDSCVSVVYHPSNNFGWLCMHGWLVPGQMSAEVPGRRFSAKREDVKDWVNYFLYDTADPLVAMFGSAYGQELRQKVTVPAGERHLTVVRATWFVPMVWVIFVAFALTMWWLVCRVNGALVIAHDERGLTKLLHKKIEDSKSELDESEKPYDSFFEQKRRAWKTFVSDEFQSTSTTSIV